MSGGIGWSVEVNICTKGSPGGSSLVGDPTVALLHADDGVQYIVGAYGL
ncbi:MAG: hypothetical protein IPP80_14570 [Ignavibacteria bacterium]|nr:hypothetical protein [Ignavibacteria bacterium]